MSTAKIIFTDLPDGRVNLSAEFKGGYNKGIESHRQCMSILQAIENFAKQGVKNEPS